MNTTDKNQSSAELLDNCSILLDDGSCLTFAPADKDGIDVIFNNTLVPLEVLIAGRQIIAGL